METLVTWLLLGLLLLPFVALTADTLGRTPGILLRVVCGVALVSALLALFTGGLQQRPNAAKLFLLAFAAWPLCLLIAKACKPSLSWVTLWFTVPIMSWYLVNASLWFYYPANGGGGGMGAGICLLLGWSYMIVPFAVLSGLLVAVRALVRRFARGTTEGQ